MSTTTRTNTDGIISASDITNTATEDRTARPQPSVPTSAAKASSTIAEAKATADAAPETTISNGPAARNRNDPALGQRMDQAKRLAESETARLTDKPDDVVQAEQSAKDAIRAVAPSASLRSTSGSLSMIGIAALGFAFYGALAFGIAAIFSATVRRVWSDDWLWILVAFALVGLFTALMQWLDDRLRQASEEAARKVFVMVAIPTITAAIMGLIAFGSTQYLALAAQLIIIPVTALLPAVTYFLFLTTRRPSILNEFIGNLGRLGLLARRSAPQSKGEPREESNAERAARVESYFQRFEAIYGALRFESGTERLTRTDFVGRLTELVETPNATLRLPQAAIFIGDIFNANLVIPIGLVTILATLGWLLVLQPFFDTTGLTVAVVTPKLTPENFAFLGAYFFGLQMLFRRFVRRDLSPNAYFAFANRIIIAMIGIWLVSAVYPVFPEQAQAPVTTASAETSGSVPVKSATPDGPAGGAVTAPPIDGAKKIEAPGGTKDGAAATTTSYRTAIILLLAFTIGVFPRVVWQFISAAVTRQIGRAHV